MSEHPYLYCEHLPIMQVDPSGFRPIKDYWDWFWGGAGSMAGGYIGGSIGGPVGGIIGGGIGGAIGLGIGDALWDLPKLVGDIWGDLKEGWNDLMNKLRKLRAGNKMLTEAGL